MPLTPLLSVVAASRNDDHGGDLRRRMQVFVDGLAAQASRHALPLELVLVEWNPPPDKAPLRETLRWPGGNAWFAARVVTVPAALHERLDPGGALPFFQMIAKNVGLRRARGRFLLATNVDVLLGDELVRTLRDGLRPGTLYRTDRVDVARDIPEGVPFETLLAFCRARQLRLHRADGTYARAGRGWRATDPAAPRTRLGRLRLWIARRRTAERRRLARLHRNGCGDFTLIDRDSWRALRGYPEWPIFSWHLDSVLLFQAETHGLRFRTLPGRQAIFHVDHGGGWTPEEQAALFARLARAGIRVMSDAEALALRAGMDDERRRGTPVVWNDEGWGLAGEALAEACV